MSPDGRRINPHGADSVAVLARGSWPAERLRTTWGGSSHCLPAPYQEQVDDAWVDALAVPGVRLFNGALCRLEAHEVDEHGLHLRLSRTTYKDYLGTNVRHPDWSEPQLLANPVGTSVALLSGDGILVFGMRGDSVALYPRHAHPFGGTMEVPEPGSTVDLIAEMAREIEEEIGINRHELDDLRAIALTEDRILRQPELVYAARTSLACANIMVRLDLHEHTACWTVPDDASAIEAVLCGPMPVSPVLRATLLAWGAERFGVTWLSAALQLSPHRPSGSAPT
jgi:hypothetical protein